MDSVSAVTGAPVQNISPSARKPVGSLTPRPVQQAERSADARSDRGADNAERAREQAAPSLKAANDFRDLNVLFDKASGKVVFQSIDIDTGEVKTQVPTEEILRLSASLRSIVGQFVDSKV